MDKEQFILSEKIYDYDKEQSFAEYIKEKRKLEKGASGKRTLSTRELAHRLGIDYEMFRKILNMNKPTKKRDCIIAICAALRLDIDETNEALILYRYMPTLDSDNYRDDLLMNILEEQWDNPLTIEQINARLIRNGFPELDIIDHRTTSQLASTYDNAPYKVLKKDVQTFAEDLAWGDQYNSLATQYSTYRYRCIANMWLDNPEKRIVYKLSAGNDGHYYIEEHGKDIFNIRSFHSIDETGNFKDYFADLDTTAKREKKKMLESLDDTKNFQKRISATIHDGKLHLFAETFNYYIPELNEYLFLSWDGHKYMLSVYPRSVFMRTYLGYDEYKKVFSMVTVEPKAEYSFESLDAEIASAKSPHIYVLKHYRKMFLLLKDDLLQLHDNLKKRKEFVNNLEYIYDDDRVCEYYGVEKEFACSFEGEYADMLFAQVSEYTFSLESGDKVIVTMKDLQRAFELGFNTIDEICQVKKKYDSIDKILDF